MIRVQQGFQLRNFLITFKPGESLGLSGSLSEDPIFGAHRPWESDEYAADREVSGLGCTEVFKVCSAHQCTELLTSEIDGWPDLYWYETMSVWLSALTDPTYGDSPFNGRLRDFLSSTPEHRQRWQNDVEERFLRSMLQVRYVSIYAAEQDLLMLDWSTSIRHRFPDPLLYRNPDYTNVNIWGSIATTGGYLYIIAASCGLALLSPLILPLKFPAWAVNTSSEQFQALIIFGGIWVYVASNAIKSFAVVGNLLRRRQPMRSNTLPMDSWHAQQNLEPDIPPRTARNQGTGATS